MKNQKYTFFIPLIIITNLFPLYGVLKYNWTLFSIVYIYWLEMLIISTFQLLKILIAKGDPAATFFSKISLGVSYFIFKTFIFFFYLLFIVVFLGFVTASHDKNESIKMLETLFLRNEFFKTALFNFFVYNLLEFLVFFIVDKQYKTSKPDDNYIIFDAHMIVVHIVIVLGTFLNQFVLDKLKLDHKTSMFICVSLFVFVKTVFDLLRQRTRTKQENDSLTYI